ncbi:MAG: response regulator [Deltaproteobacteria bacterium]|nr:MAG: response regulator [Deltaproteobacteria bacterium]
MSRTAVIIEDEPAVALLEKRILARLGFQATHTTCPEKGFELAADQGPELILLDVMLGEKSGFDLARRLKSDPRTQKIPIIYVTAKDESEAMAEGFASGGLVYLTKPFSEKNLETSIQAVLACETD